MLFQAIVLSLAATAAAIDLRFFVNREGRCYEGPFIGFANINPGVCCRPTSGNAADGFFATVGIHEIPSGWTIVGFGYRNDQCRDPLNQFIRGEGDGSDLCLYHTGHSFMSAKYGFYEKSKRSVEEMECKEKFKATENRENPSLYHGFEGTGKMLAI
ncbi:uncharacterized protein FIESC28_06939 [Fusarium coffeatum]|uniref:Uncharacterized protein n=1 Tax=Fusarium coffeatum TaxID=231269 RepID=A0A366RJI2_9HYPO|nr:uncharacterized protein FIESC28_06939 [Fusarium coffeatum]RBR16530.1 hypothetical protein FIESC28_06939 [Fusarium coffeatum]